MLFKSSLLNSYDSSQNATVFDRREILGVAGYTLIAAFSFFLLPYFGFAKKLLIPPERSMRFYNTHTGERLCVTFWKKGRYIPAALQKIDRILRDHRTNQVKKIDVRLIDLMFALKKALGDSAPFHIISGYRSPASNRMLRKRSSGVAQNSYHVKGQAVDIAFPPSVMPKALRILKLLRKGGVGYYRKSGFIHMDVRGNPSFWSS